MKIVEHALIPLGDGTRLAARIWLPDAGPSPAVLEMLPYRKRDGTWRRDDATYPAFAAAGYAGVRVDLRGSGESDGVLDDEYSPQELADACEVIAWIAAQDWCDGAVGMMGISWGGFNALQVAALRPPALKAVISLASTVDRYADDIHFKGGCHLSANLSWAATMLAYQSRPPDPALVGEAWRAMWLERLADEPFLIETWLAHPRRDAYWRHGSIAEDFAAVEVPALVIAGWADGYRNTPLKAVAGLGERARAMVGPWVHAYPHIAEPGPRADFVAEAIRWWDRWLNGVPNGADALPQVRAYILDGARPGPRAADPGRWVALDRWAEGEPFRLFAGGRTLAAAAGEGERVRIASPQDLGTAAGEFFPVAADGSMAGDQRGDDAGSLTFETEALAAPVDVLGMATLALRLVPEVAGGMLVARLVDVHPDDAATRVSLAVENLGHRDGGLVPGEPIDVVLTFDACGTRFGAGHRIRLALSTAYWPLILPPAEGGVVVDTATLRLTLPRLHASARDVEVPEPDGDPLPPEIVHTEPVMRRTVERDLQAGVTTYRIHEDYGRAERPGTGLSTREVRDECWTIRPDDPLSATAAIAWVTEMSRGEWAVRTETTATLTATADAWHVAAEVTAYEGDVVVHRKAWRRAMQRDLM